MARNETEVAQDLRALAAQVASDSERLDADFERVAPELDRLSVTGYLDRHAGLIPQAYIRTLTALRWLQAHPAVDAQRIGIAGASKGENWPYC